MIVKLGRDGNRVRTQNTGPLCSPPDLRQMLCPKLKVSQISRPCHKNEDPWVSWVPNTGTFPGPPSSPLSGLGDLSLEKRCPALKSGTSSPRSDSPRGPTLPEVPSFPLPFTPATSSQMSPSPGSSQHPWQAYNSHPPSRLPLSAVSSAAHHCPLTPHRSKCTLLP